MALFNRTLLSIKSLKSWVISKSNSFPNKLDLGIMRISPVDTPLRLKEQFIPLGRTTLIRKLSQDSNFVNKSSEVQFERLCRNLDACILNRHSLLWQQLRASYEHLNPDVELIIDGYKFSSFHRKILDDEFWFMQKLCRLLQLANFVEMNKEHLERWLKREGGPNVVQAWVEPGQYELLKVWLLGRDTGAEKKSGLKNLLAKYWPLQSKVSPFRQGDIFRRVVIAVRMKKSQKIELKIFKNLSEGELIHILPKVIISHSKFDNSMLMWNGGLFAVGICTHLMLPPATIASGWLLTSTHQMSTVLAGLSAMVGLGEWHVIQQKKSHYWQWRSELNYQSIMANNRGVIALLADRAQEEIFKEAILSYIAALRHQSGISQSALEGEVDAWAAAHCDTNEAGAARDLASDLSESVALLRQLGLVRLDPDSQTLTAIPLESAVTALETEFRANNLVDSDGGVLKAAAVDEDVVGGLPPAEAFEKLRGA